MAPRTPSRPWWAFTAAGVVVAAALGASSSTGQLWSLAYIAVAVAASLVLVVAAGRMPPGVAAVWWCFAGYAVLATAGDIVYLIQDQFLGQDPFPGPSDVAYLASYASAIVGLVLLNTLVNPGRDRATWIDAAIITLAVLGFLVVAFVAPFAADVSAWGLADWLGLAYPTLDLVLVAILARLLVGINRLRLPLALVTLAFLVTLLADLAFNINVVHGDSPAVTAITEALYLVALTLLAAAATGPGAAEIGDAVQPDGTSPLRLRATAMAVGTLAIPVLTLVVVWPDDRWLERFLAVLTIAVIVLALLRVTFLVRIVERQSEQLGRMARTDPLTGLPNRRTLDFEVVRCVDQARQFRLPLTAAMLDLDHFKQFNDRHGHQAGDRVLREVARAWQSGLPEGAFLARYGGEEFALLLPHMPADVAGPLLEGLRGSTSRDLTVSIGYAELGPAESGDELLNRADRALYAAKAAGRDRVERAL